MIWPVTAFGGAHLYDDVDHGFGIGDCALAAPDTERVERLSQWTQQLLRWLDRVLA